MQSGDAMFFDGGCIPHSVDGILKNSGPEWFKETKCARVSLLFREPLDEAAKVGNTKK
jgi:hypothetical protein